MTRKRWIVIAIATIILLVSTPRAAVIDFLQDVEYAARANSSYVLIGACLAVIAIVMVTRRRSAPVDSMIKPITTNVLLGAAAIVVVSGIAISWWLLSIANGSGAAAAELSSLRIDAIRTALAGAGGVGAALALLLAVRRQRSVELSSNVQNDDASERRITDLYDKAVDKLGSDRISVRLGGLYALDRLATAHRSMRQTVVDVLCSYVCSPFENATVLRDVDSFQLSPERRVRRVAGRRGLVRPSTDKRRLRPDEQVWDRALRIIQRQCSTVHGDPLSVDLSNAEFDDLNLASCEFDRLQITNTTIFGELNLSFSVFQGPVSIKEVDVRGRLSFIYSGFLDSVTLSGSKFRGETTFASASFLDEVRLSDCRFFDDVIFDFARWVGGLDVFRDNVRDVAKRQANRARHLVSVLGLRYPSHRFQSFSMNGSKFEGEVSFVSADVLAFAYFEKAEFSRVRVGGALFTERRTSLFESAVEAEIVGEMYSTDFPRRH